jgi:uncharacterized phage protein (predicted DNA packaging)
MTLLWPPKDAGEVLDYQIDWSNELGSDTISTSTWTVPSGLTQDSDTKTDTTATIWLSGGTAGAEYTLLNTIVTSGGRTFEQQASLAIESPGGSLVSLDRVKKHLRVDHSDDDDTIAAYQAAAETIVTEYLDRFVYGDGGSAPSDDDGTAMEVTAPITAAVLLVTEDLYEGRGSDTWDADGAMLPRTVRALLAPYRVWRVYSEGC